MIDFSKSIESKLFKKKTLSSYDAYCTILTVCAEEFGWAPEQVDRIPTKVLLSILEIHKKRVEESNKKK
jgi:hypothetical protein